MFALQRDIGVPVERIFITWIVSLSGSFGMCPAGKLQKDPYKSIITAAHGRDVILRLTTIERTSTLSPVTQLTVKIIL